MDLEDLNELLECLSAVNSTGLNDTNTTCGEEHFIPSIPAVRTKGKHDFFKTHDACVCLEGDLSLNDIDLNC